MSSDLRKGVTVVHSPAVKLGDVVPSEKSASQAVKETAIVAHLLAHSVSLFLSKR